MRKLASLTIVLPFFNDAETVALQINDAYSYGKLIAHKLRVIALHGGPSQDSTLTEIIRQKKSHPDLKIIDKKNNTEGYAVIKYGLAAATTDWVFYTDGDRQYHLSDLAKLVKKQNETGADVVNGYKAYRRDGFVRTVLGEGYRRLTCLLYQLPIHDLDCDFRLIKTRLLKKIILQSHNGAILPEMIKKLEWAGASFAEISVKHYPRIYGRSNYSPVALTIELIKGNFVMFFRLRAYRYCISLLINFLTVIAFFVLVLNVFSLHLYFSNQQIPSLSQTNVQFSYRVSRIVDVWRSSKNLKPYTIDQSLCDIALHRLNNFRKNDLFQLLYLRDDDLKGDTYDAISPRLTTPQQVLDYWLGQKNFFERLKTNFKFSCIKCTDLNCVQVVGNF
ncbi:glycosyltransferase family 2 protein [Candidatus Roizmanbacteria bacterium]|nr:glycosyltransferase family 2 protein [Candidatus Roizmanbacteria bacterium]